MRIIDADGHVQEKLIPWAELLEEPYRLRAPKMVKDNRGKDFLMIEGKLVPKPVGRGCGFLEDKDFAGAVARTYNTWLASYCKADHRRLKGVALVPIQDPPEAIKERRGSTNCSLKPERPRHTGA